MENSDPDDCLYKPSNIIISMIYQKSFSIFKDKTPRFDWAMIMVTGSVLILSSFFAAWYLLSVTKKGSVDINVTINDTVTLEREVFKQAEQKFIDRRDVLSAILINSEEEDVTEIEEALGVGEGVGEEDTNGLEDA